MSFREMRQATYKRYLKHKWVTKSELCGRKIIGTRDVPISSNDGVGKADIKHKDVISERPSNGPAPSPS